MTKRQLHWESVQWNGVAWGVTLCVDRTPFWIFIVGSLWAVGVLYLIRAEAAK